MKTERQGFVKAAFETNYQSGPFTVVASASLGSEIKATLELYIKSHKYTNTDSWNVTLDGIDVIDYPEHKVSVTTHHILEPEEQEESGYGLYSYIIFPKHPTQVRYEAYRRLIREYLLLWDDVRNYRHTSKKHLNITYLPASSKCCYSTGLPREAWYIENYDYERAIRLLQSIEQSPSSGPYIVASPIPLTRANKKPVLVFCQDLNGVPGNLMALYLRRFEDAVEDQRRGASQVAVNVALRVRTVISQLAEERISALGIFDLFRVVGVSAANPQRTKTDGAVPTFAPAGLSRLR
jgi:hypothetical protein